MESEEMPLDNLAGNAALVDTTDSSVFGNAGIVRLKAVERSELAENKIQ